MAYHRIVCVVTSRSHRHVKAVGLGNDPAHPQQTISVQKVRNRIDEGDIFYTLGPTPEGVAFVVKGRCATAGCRKRTLAFLQTGGHDVTGDNLDRLQVCPH